MHDAARHIEGLRLSLGQDRTPLGLLLAAGCPLAVKVGGLPLIPDIAGMTKRLRDELEGSAHNDSFATLLRCFEEDGHDDPSVEDWLTRIRALAFIVGNGSVRGLSKAQLETLETAIADGIVTLVDKDLPDEPSPFVQLAVWARALERQYPVELFTTNYDLLLEQAFERVRAAYFDGFVGAREPFFDNASISAATTPLPPRFTRLWKLHGSINWYETSSGQVIRSQAAGNRRRLIHPSHLKYDESRQMPYLALFDRLRAFLAQRSARLITCGYSFGDLHINAVLGDALQANPTASVVALAFSDIAKYTESRKLAGHHPNFALFARDKAIIGTREEPWGVDQGYAGSVPGVRRTGDDVEVLLGDFVQLGDLFAKLLDHASPQE
jgi:hypothetical protein